ncbi:MAG TPA: hypothetical protein VIE17_08640 [Methylophilaceae bacterium]|jgi:hypothetical protein
MKKSLLAMLCVLFGLVVVPLAYADDTMSADDSAAAATQDEQLPAMMEELPGATAEDSGS